MQVKNVQCPKCGVVLEVKNSKNETLKLIHCPSCKMELQVKFSPTQKPVTAQTFYASKAPVGKQQGETILSSGNVGKTILQTPLKKTGKAILEFQGKSYPLDMGRNVIGRKAITSHATVQIETDDRYMSRQHAVITVKSLADGTLKAVLSNDENKNETMVNGQLIEGNETIRLTDGNTITMGHTTITFKNS